VGLPARSPAARSTPGRIPSRFLTRRSGTIISGITLRGGRRCRREVWSCRLEPLTFKSGNADLINGTSISTQFSLWSWGSHPPWARVNQKLTRYGGTWFSNRRDSVLSIGKPECYQVVGGTLSAASLTFPRGGVPATMFTLAIAQPVSTQGGGGERTVKS